jgi:hypothetical protein
MTSTASTVLSWHPLRRLDKRHPRLLYVSTAPRPPATVASESAYSPDSKLLESRARDETWDETSGTPWEEQERGRRCCPEVVDRATFQIAVPCRALH